MFSMGRDGRLPLGGTWGHVNQTFKTPTNAAVGVGVLAAPAAAGDRRPGRVLPGHRGDRARSTSATCCATSASCGLAAAAGRTRAPGSSSAAGGRSSTSWPWYGARLMVINIGLWEWEGFRRLRQRAPKHLVQPADQHLPQWNGETLERPAGHPGVRVLRRRGPAVGVLYYLLSGQRGKEDVEQLEADAATGETMIA